MYIFCSSRRRHTSWPRDWSSDVCSSDLVVALMVAIAGHDDGDVVGGGGVSEDLHDACSARGVAGEEAVAIGLARAVLQRVSAGWNTWRRHDGHDACPAVRRVHVECAVVNVADGRQPRDRKSTRLNS